MVEMLLSSEVMDFVRSEDGALLREDVVAWSAWQSGQQWYKNHWGGDVPINPENLEYHLNKLFLVYAEFRNLLDYRAPKFRGILVGKFKRRTELHISCRSIGPRFIIQHGYSTIVLAKEIGSDFWVNHNVTVGSNRGVPKIGNRVMVRTGAVVVGPVSIGDDCVVTANAVVAQDMPANSVAYAPRTVFRQRK